jgi:AAA15 family ATPase/GTPase
MLIEFKVTNYRSIKETLTFSMVANSDAEHEASHCMESGISKTLQLLRSAAIYGPNASGKTNIITALMFMRELIATSATAMREGQTFNISSFRFDDTLKQAPSEFEMAFVQEGVRYQYGFALTPNRIVKEWLFAYVKQKPQRWFEREYDTETQKESWYFGPHFSAAEGQRLLWEKSTRSNALFLSTAVNLNSEQLRPLFKWFVEKLTIVPTGALFNPAFTLQYLNRGNVEKNRIINFLQAADFAITDIKVEKRKQPHFNIQLQKDQAPVHTTQEIEVSIVSFDHKTRNKKTAQFSLAEESTGTQLWFSFAGYLLDVLQQGRVLVVDELGTSLHTLLVVQHLIKSFHTADLNVNKAQLIFSTHNTTLLDQDLFRRDQIWFIEQDSEAASQLYPLTDFSPRKSEALEKGYLQGRYGALPFVGDIKF